MNKLFLIGNLTRDPEMSETATGVAFCRLGIAVNRPYQGSDGERTTDFFNVTVWRTHAENCGRYLKKGSKVAIVGSLQNRQYEDKDGNKRQVTDIIANEVEFLSVRAQGEGMDIEMAEPIRRSDRPALEPVNEDDLPF
jgi:single-strand DNA-binding protein